MRAKKRNYKREYEKFQSSEKSKKDRAKRNGLRRLFTRLGKERKGDGKHIHHEGDKAEVMPASQNLGMPEKSRLKGSKRK